MSLSSICPLLCLLPVCLQSPVPVPTRSGSWINRPPVPLVLFPSQQSHIIPFPSAFCSLFSLPVSSSTILFSNKIYQKAHTPSRVLSDRCI
ncbi:hypothetical protein F5H01DRAFT_335140 [Linnemannia elongata]|nr:hypothetical protein F5H01DRAFT_335140 [Linnemannia elongata]